MKTIKLHKYTKNNPWNHELLSGIFYFPFAARWSNEKSDVTFHLFGIYEVNCIEVLNKVLEVCFGISNDSDTHRFTRPENLDEVELISYIKNGIISTNKMAENSKVLAEYFKRIYDNNDHKLDLRSVYNINKSMKSTIIELKNMRKSELNRLTIEILKSKSKKLTQLIELNNHSAIRAEIYSILAWFSIVFARLILISGVYCMSIVEPSEGSVLIDRYCKDGDRKCFEIQFERRCLNTLIQQVKYVDRREIWFGDIFGKVSRMMAVKEVLGLLDNGESVDNKLDNEYRLCIDISNDLCEDIDKLFKANFHKTTLDEISEISSIGTTKFKYSKSIINIKEVDIS